MSKVKTKTTTEFNYVIGHQWSNNNPRLGCYTFFSEVQFGDVKDAKKFLKYVQKQSPEHNWKIYLLTELPTS